MDLVPVAGADAHAEHDGRPAADSGPEVTIDQSVVQKMNVRFATVERRDLKRRISTVGNLDYDEERMVSVTTRYSGFIEKVFVNHVGQPVRRGDPLFEVYSPELVQTQRELISAVSYAKRFDQPSGRCPGARRRRSSKPREPGSSTGRFRPNGWPRSRPPARSTEPSRSSLLRTGW